MSAAAYPTRGRSELLLEPAIPDRDPEGLISRYLAFALHRFAQVDKLPLTGNLTERLRALHWYLTDYRNQRGAAPPLSATQIAFLNGPVPVIGAAPEMSVAAYSFIANERGPAEVLAQGAALRDALFWWCTERAPSFAPAGELITQAQAHILRHVEEYEFGTRLHLNFFVRRLMQVDPSIADFDVRQVAGRATLLATLLLRSADKPYLLKLLPHASVAEFIGGESGTSTFDLVLASALGTEGAPDAAAAAELRALVEARLTQHGLTLADPTRRPDGGRPGAAAFLGHDPAIRPGLEAGIAVIGPNRIASGLGQAARLSIETLRQAGRRPATLDFGLGNPGRVGFSTAEVAQPLRTPRQINLLHLNAEAVPFAFAYLDQRILARSYNIGFFFWELDRVPESHRLGLDLVDEVWVASEYNRAAYERVARVPVRNVGMAVEPLPEPARLARTDLGIPDDAFVFLATFDSFSFVERKNPLGLIAAFRSAFPEGTDARVVLILKTQNRTRVSDPHQAKTWRAIDDAVAQDPRIRLIDRTMRYEDLLGLKRLCDAYVSLHRSEGLGFGLIEAMQLGLPVVATGYSGNMDFCSADTAYLVEYDLVQAMPAEYVFVERGSQWADPSLASAVGALRSVYADPAEARARGARAARDVADRFSVAAIARRYDARLREIEALIAARAAP